MTGNGLHRHQSFTPHLLPAMFLPAPASCPSLRTALLVMVLAMLSLACRADEPAPTGDALRSAVTRGLTVVQTAARNYPQHRQCFSCHHQTLPAFAMVTAREAGFEIDEPLLAEQLEFTRKSFADRKDDIARGQNVGGRSATVGYALWMFDVCRAERDEITDALASFLLVRQEDDGRWQPPSRRPPMEESPVPCTLFAAYGLEKYAPEARRADAEAAIERARTWLAAAPMSCQDDLVSRLWFLHLLGNDAAALESARTELLSKQHADGGWSQTDELASDAYATGQAVYVLRLAGLPRDDASLRRAGAFLIKTQEPDGSWHVVTRSKPIQTWFDNGDPHGTDQFISTPATCWAVAALAGLEPPRD